MWLSHIFSMGKRELEKMRDEITNEGEERKLQMGEKREDEEATLD